MKIKNINTIQSMKKDEADDEILVRKITEGNRDAEDKLYRKYHSPLLSKLSEYFINIDDAEDLLQDTMIITLEKIKSGEYEHRGVLFSYISSISWRLYKKFYNSRIYKSPITNSENIISVELFNDGIEILTEKRISYIKHAFKLLDKTCKELLTYFIFDGLKPRYIISIMPEFDDTQQISRRKYKCFEKLERKVKKLMKNEEQR